MAKFDCSKLVVPHWDSYRNVYVSAFLKRDERNAYYLEKFPGYEFVGKDEEKYEDVYYMVNKEDGTAMAVCTGNKHFGQIIYDVLPVYRHNNIEYKVVLLYVVKRSRDISVYLTENIQDVYYDRFLATGDDGTLENGKYDYHSCRFYFHDWNMRQSKYLEIKGASLYSAGHKRLICFSSKEYLSETDDMSYLQEVEEIYPGALRGFSSELYLPQVKEFDELSFGDREEYFHYQLTFGDKLEKLTLRFAKLKNTGDSKNAPLLINRDSDQVEINYFGHDEYKADEAGHIVFAAPEPNKTEPDGSVLTLTLAGSAVDNLEGGEKLRCDKMKWKIDVEIHADIVADFKKIRCKCFNDHYGTELLLMGPCSCSKKIYEMPLHSIYVYEDIDTVRSKLNLANWQKRKCIP